MLNFMLKKLEDKELEIVLEWRNSDRVRNFMYNNQIISLEEHKKWFRKISQSDSDQYYTFVFNDKPVGLVYFNDIDKKNKHCFWGFYIGDTNVPKGSGTAMGYLGLNIAFENLDMNKIYGEVLSINERSIIFHEKLGFIREGHFRKHILRENNYLDVYRYGLLKDEWVRKKIEILKFLNGKGFDLNENCNSL